MPDAAGHYQLGTIANCVTAGLSVSLQNIHKLSVENIRAHVKPLTDRLQKELPSLGYPSMTPLESPTPIVTFVVKNPEATIAKLKKANVTAKVWSTSSAYRHRCSTINRTSTSCSTL